VSDAQSSAARHRSGYVEGFYANLLEWSERKAIVDVLESYQLRHYLYAPKEDVRHRFRWREPYDANWFQQFSNFCSYARERHVLVTAGVAPGLDFDFGDLPDGPDFSALVDKCQKLIKHGAQAICLLMDDIDADFHLRNGGIEYEGEAHALLANSLANAIGQAIQVVPRIYATELAGDAPDYLPRFFATLQSNHTVIYCGHNIVAESLVATEVDELSGVKNKIVFWDNLYANDYCPRRLFVGPWSGRDQTSPVLLNPTGMVNTDCFLLTIMGLTLQQQSKKQSSAEDAWRNALSICNIPDEFLAVSAFFKHPVFNSREWEPSESATKKHYSALEHLLWRWKTPLAREWYPFIMGLKNDLLINEGQLSTLRIQKTQPIALATHLLK